VYQNLVFISAKKLQKLIFLFKVEGIDYDNSAFGYEINGILSIKNNSADTIYIDKIIFDAPKGQYYNYEHVTQGKDGNLIREGKLKPADMFETAGMINVYANMSNYYFPPCCSAAYYYSYTTFIKRDDTFTQENFLDIYNKLPGHIYLNNGITMPFTLEFDKMHLLLSPRSFELKNQ